MGASFYLAYAKIVEMDKTSHTNTTQVPRSSESIKIKYETHMGTAESIIAFIGIFFYALPIILPLAIMFLSGASIDWGKNTPTTIISVFLPYIIIGIGFIAAFIFFRKRRIENEFHAKELMKQGQLIMGQIIEVREHKRSKRYNYEVRFMDPRTKKLDSFETPDLEERPNFDLDAYPLDVKVYYDGRNKYASEIVNPPMSWVGEKKKSNSLAVIATFILITGISLSTMMLIRDNILIGIGILAGTLLIGSLLTFRHAEK